MATSVRLIRPASSLAKQSNRHPHSALHHSLPATLLSVRRTFATTVISKDRGSDNSVSSNNIGNSDNNAVKKTGGDVDSIKAKSSITSTTETESAEAAAERQRVIAQDATLKEILESAATEKKKLQEELMRKQRLALEQEQKRQAAIREAAEAAEKAEAEATAKAKAAAEAEKKKSYEKATEASSGPNQGQAAANRVSESTLGSRTAVERVQQSLSTSSKDSAKSATATAASSSPSVSSATAAEKSPQSLQRDNEFIDDPLEPFKARLLPYKKSLESSTEYIRSSLPDSLRQLQESVKRKDYRDLISQLSEHLNNFTGYTAINDLKSKVIAHGDSLDKARISLLQSKQAYEDAIGTRSDTQKAINDLLQRKHLWSPDDVIRFTDLYRSEHANEQAELKTKNEYKQAESDVEEKSRRLTRVIMERYHEEQVWSDKIRAASTYGTWGLVGVNVMAFLIVQAFVEPRRRRKQVERYEELVDDLTERGILPNRSITDSTSPNHSATQPIASPVAASAENGSGAGTVAIGGALLGGEDVLLKMIESAERQEERLGRMEALLMKSPLEGIRNDSTNPDAEHPSTPSFVVAEDGAILFISPESEEESLGTEGFVLDGDEQVVFGAQSGGAVSSRITEDKNSFRTEGRIKRMLTDGGQEVLATRSDFLISGLGGAILGGLVTMAVMMYR
ncbi:sensitive to high expression protein 9, mitochondrial [Entomortierella parvispora]|uniref:Sensitive to high expression protein 9, mitochondrial n=1 Tax=Entomortierella parvispora TaxID=205924 RepID=A0A9P3H563_9FUNG|nr:sensitive to high expression protein 9, mitochondrial [Entomortierella parvispora]